MSDAQSPTVRRRRLGMELRRLREASNLMIEDVAKHLECSMSRVSRIETGKSVARIRDVRDMLDLYKVGDEAQREQLLTLAKDAQQRGWWTEYESVLSAGLDTYVGLEASAASLRTFQTHLIPGLMQTEEYARALIKVGRPTESTANIDRMISLRQRRQAMLADDGSLEVWAVLDEAVLRRPIGGVPVMRAQLARLLEAEELPSVTIQVLPFARGAHPGLGGAFTIIGFPDPTDLDVVYVDSPAGNIFLEKDRDVRRHTTWFDHLRAAALPPDESTDFIAAVADELKKTSPYPRG
ncbi:helix-turn-helix domain-containing protein [Actinoallomurus iriomotensis]|uniref:Transcriptional regulator n=1 Tax=Actinoallomurus iriomotensis TaxID=478107 RepID=A0A9W6S1M4_9ACTN|nr:helix-turn-helix transcriptional regulator [Actinoallomurus iriomotensis]GLY79494.1 transcriptional regulator [Actinoallomurus iriomotensis]GLY86340.1 transcriptional regulator [Actinoallomurus iriomotensis]